MPQDAGMQSAVFQGLYGVKAAEPFTCPGVCRWPGSYTSLGFKAECKNVTQQALQTMNCYKSTEAATTLCEMKTPGDVTIVARLVLTDASTVYCMNTTSQAAFSQGFVLPQYNDDGQFQYRQDLPEVARFAIFRSTTNANFDAMLNINVTECSLYVTGYEYTDATANGSDFYFASRREVDFAQKPWDIASQLDSPCLIANETTRGDIHTPALMIDYPGMEALHTFLSSAPITGEFVDGDFRNTNLGVSAALMGDVDLYDRFDAMATAMTDYVRYGPNMQLAYGQVIQTEPFVSIRWGYFAVPVAIEALAILFAILSIANNRRSRNVPLWKSSTLAVLACQHNEKLELLQTTGKGIAELEVEAKTLNVHLQ